ncbi:type II secretion system F family protein [Mycolicibacterium neoaurum]|uniref:type II secretion system F family protein n=1 Tax=Mycolicibacterium neoaurum TaxID=1795 RepID=UPI00248CF253|nr:type II secretion system F family protein [Mycolicibacterium neoaurum]WBP93454.1 type II secretion system F family protein [Mycolicibacterium neoaurum]WBS07248.1 type II secretion system F family protein [Mycolicibacterium neoaurum]
MTVAVILLAAALLVLPTPAGHRLGPRRRPRRRRRISPAWLGAPATVLAMLWWEPTVVLACLLVAATVAHRRRRAACRRAAVAEALQLRDALDVLVGELRVGAHPVAALSAAAGEVGGQVGDRLRTVSAHGRLGADIAVGLSSVAETSAIPAQWRRLALCWQLAHHHGLAVATLLRAAQHDIVERDRFRLRLDAGLAGPRTTAAVLAGMPVLGILLGQLIGAEPVRFLVAGGPGGVILLIGVALSCLGLYWSDRIITAVAS